MESSSVPHTRGEQTLKERKRAQAHRWVNTPGESGKKKKKTPERRVTSLTAAETVTRLKEEFLGFFFTPYLSLRKGCRVVNNAQP